MAERKKKKTGGDEDISVQSQSGVTEAPPPEEKTETAVSAVLTEESVQTAVAETKKKSGRKKTVKTESAETTVQISETEEIKTETSDQSQKEEAEQISMDLQEQKTLPPVPSSYYELEDEKEVSDIVYLWKALKNKFKKDKTKKKKKKFNPLPSVHATRYHPPLNVGLNEEQLNERFENDLINKVENKYSKSYKSIFIGNIFTFFNFLGLLCAIALIICHAAFNRFLFCIVYLFNISIGIIQEIRAKHSIEKLSLMSSRSAKVIRNGVETEISTGEKLLHVAVTIRIIFYTKLGNRSEKINNAMPQINTTTVRRLTPFHSFSTMPQILLKKTFSDIRMLHEKASITGESVK